MPKLTKVSVERLAIQERDYFSWDTDIAGFGIRVWPSGRKVYMAQYRAAGRTRRVKIGAHGPVTTEQARTQAKIILGSVARGEDPAEEKATRRKSITMADLCDGYVRAAERGLIMGKRQLPKKASTLGVDRGRIERHIKPLMGKKLVRDLVPADIHKFIRDVTIGKTAVVVKTGKARGKAVVEGGAGTASRTTGLLGGILTFAVNSGIRADNPVRGIKRQADNRRDRRLSANEYKAVGAALLAADNGVTIQQAMCGVWLLALTGCRLNEIQRLRVDEVDAVNRCLRLKDSKEGASIRPIGKPVFDIIKRVAGDEYILPAERGEGHYGGLSGAVARIMNAANLDGVTAHTLRHSFASVAGDLGFSDSTIGALLGHVGSTITSRYVHRLDSVMIAAANKVAGEVWRQMTGETAKVALRG